MPGAGVIGAHGTRWKHATEKEGVNDRHAHEGEPNVKEREFLAADAAIEQAIEQARETLARSEDMERARASLASTERRMWARALGARANAAHAAYAELSERREALETRAERNEVSDGQYLAQMNALLVEFQLTA
tara:strand:- start:4506 stop:4907 length:402 start_codon:yes stop_codon:yes gene_type:complete